MIGCTHLAPSWIFSGRDGILAVDIGGSNIWVDVVELNRNKAADLSRSKVGMSDLWTPWALCQQPLGRTAGRNHYYAGRAAWMRIPPSLLRLPAIAVTLEEHAG